MGLLDGTLGWFPETVGRILCGMSDEMPSSPVEPGAVPAPSSLPPGRALSSTAGDGNAPDFFAALGSPWRWRMLKMLADGRALSATDVSRAMKRDFDGVSKHLRVLRQAGVVHSQKGMDRRLELFYIPQENRPEPGVLQWGFVRLDLRPRS